MDIAAGEDHMEMEKFPELHAPHLLAMQRAKQLGLNITVHAGEVGGPKNIR